ncbi:MAG TPA: ribosome maturation factor RimM [Atribacteraceae bacterium]|nr:ribosome maturation factor RimM [Atribacteraceae bacterium]
MRIFVGQVLRFHGTQGSIKVRPLTDRPDRFQIDAHLLLGIPGSSFTPVCVESLAPLGKDLIVAFHGRPIPLCEPRISRYWLAVDEEGSSTGEGDTFYHYQLVNLRVLDRGKYVGVVRDIVFHDPYDFLVIEGDGKEYLMPFIAVYCRKVDIEKGSLLVHCPDGFWE